MGKIACRSRDAIRRRYRTGESQPIVCRIWK